jgi:hypothetical protein
VQSAQAQAISRAAPFSPGFMRLAAVGGAVLVGQWLALGFLPGGAVSRMAVVLAGALVYLPCAWWSLGRDDRQAVKALTRLWRKR